MLGRNIMTIFQTKIGGPQNSDVDNRALVNIIGDVIGLRCRAEIPSTRAAAAARSRLQGITHPIQGK